MTGSNDGNVTRGGAHDSTPEASDGVAASTVEQLQAVVAAQMAMIEGLQQRLDRLEAVGGAPTEGATAAPKLTIVRGPTSRRQLMTKGAAVAAGAAIAGTVLNVATASPAAADNFFGNPAVNGSAVPGTGIGVFGNTTSGVGVMGLTSTGTGVLGQADATSGDQAGVQGMAKSSTGSGVKGYGAARAGKTIGVYGLTISPEGCAVFGESTATTGQPTGTLGIVNCPEGFGVRGINDGTTGTGKGTYGGSSSPDGYGVYGANLGAGIGVFGVSAGIGLVGLSTKTQLKLAGAPPVPVSSTAPRQAGEVVFDINREMWVCVTSGSPGTWRRIGGPGTAGALTVLASTVRLYDSRPGTSPSTGQKGIFVDHQERVIDATVGGAVPAGAAAVLINATATNTNPGGFFAFFKNGVAWPRNSSLSWGVAGSTIANQAVVAVDEAATFKARMEGAGGADLIVDCIGYYR